ASRQRPRWATVIPNSTCFFASDLASAANGVAAAPKSRRIVRTRVRMEKCLNIRQALASPKPKPRGRLASPARSARRRERAEARRHENRQGADEQGICHALPVKNICFDADLQRAASSRFVACPLFRNTCDSFDRLDERPARSPDLANGRAIIAVEVGRAGVIEV